MILQCCHRITCGWPGVDCFPGKGRSPGLVLVTRAVSFAPTKPHRHLANGWFLLVLFVTVWSWMKVKDGCIFEAPSVDLENDRSKSPEGEI